MAAFSSASFSTAAFSNSAFDFGSTPAPTIETYGGFDERNYHAYRKHIEQLTQIAEERIYPKRALEAAEALQDLPVETSEIKKLTEKPEIKGTLRLTPQINYEALQREIDLIRAYLDLMENHRREQEDELAFLLMIQ